MATAPTLEPNLETALREPQAEAARTGTCVEDVRTGASRAEEVEQELLPQLVSRSDELRRRAPLVRHNSSSIRERQRAPSTSSLACRS